MRDTGKPLDEVVLAEELERKGLLAAVGGIIRLNSITNRIPTTAHLSYFIDQVRNTKGLRDIIAAAERAIEGAHNNQGDVSGLAAEVEERMLAATRGVESKLPPIIDMAERFRKPPPKPDAVIHDMLHRRSLMNIGGMSKARKSWIVLHLALAVATGQPWLGLNTKKGKVLILNFEIDAGFYTERSKAVASELGITLPAGSIDCWDLRGYAKDLSDLKPAIMARLHSKQYDLVILDPIYMVMGRRKECDAGDMTDLLNEISEMAVQGNTAIAFCTHFAKGNAATKNSIDRASGSGVLARYPDAIVTLTEHEEDECVVFEATVRNAKPLPKFVLRWDFPLFTRDDQLDPKQLKGLGSPESTEKHEGRRPKHSVGEILGFFPAAGDEPIPFRAAQRFASDGCGIGQGAFQTIRNKLLEGGWVQQDSDMRWHRTKRGDEYFFDWKNGNIYQQGATDGSE